MDDLTLLEKLHFLTEMKYGNLAIHRPSRAHWLQIPGL